MEAAIMASAVFIWHGLCFHASDVNIHYWTFKLRPWLGFVLMLIALGRMFSIF